jgi:hypothetical protein
MSTQKDENAKLKKVLTPEFRVSFPQVFTPKSFNGSKEKYSIVMLFDKKTVDIQALKKAAHVAIVERWGADKKKWPDGLKLPFKDGDKKADMVGYEGTTVVSASSNQKPSVVGGRKGPDGRFPEITEASGDFYAGCYARATLVAFAYPKEGVKGISPGVAFAIQNIQKLRDGEQFSGRKKAEDEFDEVEDGSDDKENFAKSEDLEDDDDFLS